MTSVCHAFPDRFVLRVARGLGHALAFSGATGKISCLHRTTSDPGLHYNHVVRFDHQRKEVVRQFLGRRVLLGVETGQHPLFEKNILRT